MEEELTDRDFAHLPPGGGGADVTLSQGFWIEKLPQETSTQD